MTETLKLDSTITLQFPISEGRRLDVSTTVVGGRTALLASRTDAARSSGKTPDDPSPDIMIDLALSKLMLNARCRIGPQSRVVSSANRLDT